MFRAILTDDVTYQNIKPSRRLERIPRSVYVNPRHLPELEIEEKILPYEQMRQVIRDLRLSGLSPILGQGVYDILHRGHGLTIRELHRLDPEHGVVILGIENDGSVARNKGVHRPINPEFDRAWMLAALSYADLVFVYPDIPNYNDPQDFIDRYRFLQPDTIGVSSFDPHMDLKLWQAEEAGTTISTLYNDFDNSTTEMLRRLGYEE